MCWRSTTYKKFIKGNKEWKKRVPIAKECFIRKSEEEILGRWSEYFNELLKGGGEEITEETEISTQRRKNEEALLAPTDSGMI